MLRTTNKKAGYNLDMYVVDCMKDSEENLEIKEYYECLYKDFIRVEGWQLHQNVSWYEVFKDYMRGLPYNFTYYYHSAIKELGDILEETEEERNRFAEYQAEEKLSSMIFNRMVKVLEL